MRQSENVFRVSFRGNAYTSRQTVHNYALLRSAELTVENGYEYFDMLDADTDVTLHAVSTPTTVQSRTTYNQFGSYTDQTIHHGGTSYAEKPTAEVIIRCSHAKTNDGSFNAAILIESMRDRITKRDTGKKRKKTRSR